jgi:hypothetical protein
MAGDRTEPAQHCITGEAVAEAGVNSMSRFRRGDLWLRL